MEIKMIPIPSSIADVTPELCRRVFEEICGLKTTVDRKMYYDFHGKGKHGWTDTEYYILPDGQYNMSVSEGNPFTRLQDTKLLDDWLENNELSMTINKKPDAVNGEYIFEVLIYSDVDYREINVQVYADTEEMARACAIIDAYNRRNHEK